MEHLLLLSLIDEFALKDERGRYIIIPTFTRLCVVKRLKSLLTESLVL